MLALIRALGGSISKLDFQKLLFLYCREKGGERLYEFIPYKLGAFSFNTYADVRKLAELGLVRQDESEIWITDRGQSEAIDQEIDRFKLFVSRYSNLRGYTLVAETYRKYPYYAIKSEILDSTTGDDEAVRNRIEEARPVPRPGKMLTIGYQNRSLESYLNALLRGGATILCDVRRNAISRKYGFSKPTLITACSGVGIRYEHRPELGISSERRSRVRNATDLKNLLTDYEQNDIPECLDTIEEISSWLASGECVALTCYEHLPSDCHRGRLASVLEDISDIRQEVGHL